MNALKNLKLKKIIHLNGLNLKTTILINNIKVVEWKFSFIAALIRIWIQFYLDCTRYEVLDENLNNFSGESGFSSETSSKYFVYKIFFK